MTQPALPDPIAAYFAADQQDGAAVARCFTENGVVLDEGQTHVGRPAIAAWKTAASARFSYRVEPHTVETGAGETLVTARLTGSFPGSPVDLRYRFALAPGGIARLEIAP